MKYKKYNTNKRLRYVQSYVQEQWRLADLMPLQRTADSYMNCIRWHNRGTFHKMPSIYDDVCWMDDYEKLHNFICQAWKKEGRIFCLRPNCIIQKCLVGWTLLVHDQNIKDINQSINQYGNRDAHSNSVRYSIYLHFAVAGSGSSKTFTPKY